MMKKNKSLKIVLICLLIAAIVGAIGATAAYMIKETQNVQNDFIPAKVTCNVNEVFDGNEKSSITVQNTGNINAYIRVRFVSYWVNDEGNIVGKPSAKVSFDYNSDLWVLDEANDTYYYTKPVAPGDSTPELLGSKIVLQTSEFNGKPVYQVIEVLSEAIQAKGETDEGVSAIEYAWKHSFN